MEAEHRGDSACTSKFITCYVTLDNKAVTAGLRRAAGATAPQAGANQIPMGWPVAPRKEHACSRLRAQRFGAQARHNLLTLSRYWLTTKASS